MITNIKPTLRALRYGWLYNRARWQTLRAYQESSASITFVVGCGRSGTTILGRLLSEHPQIKYWFEPYHLWAAIDAETDILGLYSHRKARLMLNENDATSLAKRRFWNLFRGVENQQIVEKTPLNVFRIGYLRTLAPQSKFVHIVRDGVDVACSIGKIAANSPYKIAGKPGLNQWWGVSNRKWEGLKREGAKADYWPDYLLCLETESQRGAYEWMASLREMDRWRDALGESCLEIVYDQFVEEPKEVLFRLCEFLGLDVVDSWLMASAQTVRSPKPQPKKTVELPGEMAEDFNHYQSRYQFTQRAIENRIVMS